MVEPNSETDSATAELPRFGILDLMVVTTAFALIFALRQAMSQQNLGFESDLVWFQVLEQSAFALSLGLPLAAVYRFHMQKKIVGQYLVEPGHWLLLGILVSNIGFIILMALSLILFAGQPAARFSIADAWWYFLPGFLGATVAAIVLWRGIGKTEKWWKTVFLAYMICYLIGVIQNLLMIGPLKFFLYGQVGVWIRWATFPHTRLQNRVFF